MEGFFAFLTVAVFFLGMLVGSDSGADNMRPKVVLYCIEKPQLCKEEYTSIKTQQKLEGYQLPEIK